MEFDKHYIKFNPEERHMTALAERVPLSLAHAALRRIERARAECYKSFVVLLTCDLDLLADTEAEKLPLYVGRLQCLDELSQKMVPVVAPQLIADFEQLFAEQYSLDSERLGVTKR